MYSVHITDLQNLQKNQSCNMKVFNKILILRHILLEISSNIYVMYTKYLMHINYATAITTGQQPFLQFRLFFIYNATT